MMFEKKNTFFITGGILVLFLSFLLVMNYRSQIRLRESTLAQLVQHLERQAEGVSYFFSERFLDMKNLARSREIHIFFENKALGMSMLYGLRASLLQIQNRFDQLLDEKQMGGVPVYSRVVFVNESGTLLVDRRISEYSTHTAESNQKSDLKTTPRHLHDCLINWSGFLKPERQEPLIETHFCEQSSDESVDSNRGHLDILTTIPYTFKSNYRGQVVAWLNCRLMNGALVKKKIDDTHTRIFIDFAHSSEKNSFNPSPPIDRGAQLSSVSMDETLLNFVRKIPLGKPALFEMKNGSKRSISHVGIRVPISGTPFFLNMATPSYTVLGHTHPVHLLIAMMALGLLVAGSSFLLWRMDAKALILSTQLKEESLRKEQVEAIVKERTFELEKAQKALLNKALDAGRAQLSAMILHNIGNAMTPAGVNMERLRKSKMKHLNHYLLQCYNDLAKHKKNLTAYVSDHPRGKEVARYMGQLIEDLEKERKKAAGILNDATTAIEYVSEVITLQRSYAPGNQEMKEKVRLNQVVLDALKIQKATIVSKNIIVETELVSNIPPFSIEKNKLMQVVINFIKNSCDAIEENRDVASHHMKLSTAYENGKINLIISDSGCGVEADRLEAIFQFGVSTKGSSGFGLYYCKSFVEANQGELMIYSPGRNQGATITMRFDVERGGVA